MQAEATALDGGILPLKLDGGKTVVTRRIEAGNGWTIVVQRQRAGCAASVTLENRKGRPVGSAILDDVGAAQLAGAARALLS
jgi:hypothetical protein